MDKQAVETVIMEKKTFKTKTFWIGLASICTGIGLVVAGQHEQGITLIVQGALAIMIRDGIQKIGK